MVRDHVVAGLDGSAPSRNAAHWAAVEATRRRTALHLVYGRSEPPDPVHGRSDFPAERSGAGNVTDGGLWSGRSVLTEMAGVLRRAHPLLEIGTHLDHRPAATALRAESVAASLTVVGSWGSNRPPTVPFGSVAFAVASDNIAPVAVIHPQDHPQPQGCVVIAIDGSATADEAVDFAFAAAELRHADLVAIHVRHDVAIDGAFPFQVVTDAAPTRAEEEAAALAERLAPWRDKYPVVHLLPVVAFGSPTPTLLDFAGRAQLVVVGSHGTGNRTGKLLGATCCSLVERGPCPVVVIRSIAPG